VSRTAVLLYSRKIPIIIIIIIIIRDEHRLRVLENRVLRRIFGSKKDGVTGSGEDYITSSIMTCIPPNIIRKNLSRRMR
jgi:hypothetical protein